MARGATGALCAAFVGTLTVSATPAAVGLAAGACAGDDCDSDTQSWGSCTQGELAGGDPDTWESGPVTGPAYLDFHGERTWVLDPTPWMGTREPIGYQSYLSLNPAPNADGGGGFAQPAGNLAEFTVTKGGHGWTVQVLNDTCAQYYLRVVLTYSPTTRPSGGTACGADSGT